MKIIGILLLLALVLLVFCIGIYNKLVTLRQRFKNAFAQIDVQLKRRYDLIPNLVETVKAYMEHERETLDAVIKARNQAHAASEALSQVVGNPEAMAKFAGAEQMLNGAMGRLFAVAERYPDLKANQNMMQLNEELATTENKIAFARQAYNDAVMQYNTATEVFPNMLIAGSFGFKPAALYEVDDVREKEAPKLEF